MIFLRFTKEYLLAVKFKLFGAILCGLYKFLLTVYIAWVIGTIVGVLENNFLSIQEKQDQIITLFTTSLFLIIISPVFKLNSLSLTIILPPS